MPHILIIDDDHEFRVMLKDLLSELGHTTSEAIEGGSGLDLYKRESFDLVFIDVIMPGKEGIETIPLLRSINPEVKIIAMSGGGAIGPDDYLDMALLMGAKKSLKKPFRLSDVRDAIHELLGE